VSWKNILFFNRKQGAHNEITIQEKVSTFQPCSNWDWHENEKHKGAEKCREMQGFVKPYKKILLACQAG
jgi:hypothetical protein